MEHGLSVSTQTGLSEYVISQKLFNPNYSCGSSVLVYYLTDLHLEYYIKDPENINKEIEKIVEKLKVNSEYYSFESIIYIGGDVSNNIELSRTFYKCLREHFFNYRIVAVLGNHEISEFEHIEDAVKAYSDMFSSLNICFLHNQIKEVEFGFLGNQKFRCVGGIGFAPYNERYNVNSLIVSRDMQFNREKEYEESQKFILTYEEALKNTIADNIPLLVFTHYPIQDWLTGMKVDPHCFYFTGHTHRNDFCFKDDAVIIADNQIGYKAKRIQFKSFCVGVAYNPFYFYKDGYYKISVADYFAFYRYNGQMMEGEGKMLTNQINKGNSFYMIKKNGFYMFVIVGAKDSWLCVGAKIKKIVGVSHVEYFYNTFDKMIQSYIQLFSPIYKCMKEISDKLKKYGFDGRIHGFIIDLDFYNHIMLNPIDGKITFYNSPEFGIVKEYGSIKLLIRSIRTGLLKEDYSSVRSYNQECKRLSKAMEELDIGNNILLGPDNAVDTAKIDYVRVNVGQGSVYEYSRKMLQIQRLFECNILREWTEEFIADLYIDDEYRPTIKPITDYRLVKNDWHNYLQLSPDKKTKKTTLACFPVFESDYDKPKRIIFPHTTIDSFFGDREVDNIITEFIEAIPLSLLEDADVLDELKSCLSATDFLRLYPKRLLTDDLIKDIIDNWWSGGDFSFPDDIITYAWWKYIYDSKEFCKRKKRPSGFPKDVWEKLRTTW